MNSTRIRSLAFGALAALTLSAGGGCAAGTAEPGAAPADGSAQANQPRRRRDLITADELATVQATNLYDAIQRLRPDWLRGTSISSINNQSARQVVVYQDNVQLGTVEALRQVSPGYARAIRWMDGNEASNTLPGLGSRIVQGAIVIETPGASR